MTDIFNKDKYIIIEKYHISKEVLMSEPIQLYVTNSETKVTELYYDYKLFEILQNKGLDVEPLHEYFDDLYGITKKERQDIIKKFDEYYNNGKI
jgi:hypothetical protein